MERLLNLIGSSPEATDTLNQFLTYYTSSDSRCSDLGDFFLQDNHEYSKLLLGAMEYAIFPHGVRPRLSTLAGITNKESAWEWVTSQITTFVEKDDWMHAQHLPKIAHAFSRIFFTIARAKFPVYLPPDRAASLFDMWRIINETRMRRNQWSFLGEDFTASSPSVQLFRKIVERNQNRMQKRYLQINNASAASADVGSDDDIDEEWPVSNPEEQLGLPAAIALSLSGCEPYSSSIGKRSREAADVGSEESDNMQLVPLNQGASRDTEDDSDSSTEEWKTNDYGVPVAGWEGRLLDISEADLQNAIDFPLAGWPTYEELYGMPKPNCVKSEDSMIRFLVGDPPTTRFYRYNDGDPVSLALIDHHAVPVPNSEWTTLNAKGHSYPSMEGRPYKIYRLPPRQAMDHPTGEGPFALRLGPNGSGELMQWLDTPSAAPGVRRSSMRELLMILENPLQIGFPSTILSDSCLGFATYALQSAEILFGPIGTTHEILIRIEGRRCKGHSDRTQNTQRAKLGYCPCCTRPTHVALPFSYDLGVDDPHKRVAMDLWAEWGPWGQRRYAGVYYALLSNDRRQTPPGWDWAARTLHIAYPPLLIRGTQNGPPTPILTVDEARRQERLRRQRAMARPQVRPPPPMILDRASSALPRENKLPADNQQADVEMQGASDSCNNVEQTQPSESSGLGPYPKFSPHSGDEQRDSTQTQENIQDYGKSWHNWTSSAKMASGKYGKAPYQQLNSSQGNGKQDCMRGGKREGSETPSRGGYREKGVSPMTAAKKPEHLGWSIPKNPGGKSNSPVKQENSQRSKSDSDMKGNVCMSANEKPSEKQSEDPKSDPSFSVAQSTSPEQPKGVPGISNFNLASAIPETPDTQPSPQDAAWRGLRRPRNPPSSSSGNVSSNWRSWHDWKKTNK